MKKFDTLVESVLLKKIYNKFFKKSDTYSKKITRLDQKEFFDLLMTAAKKFLEELSLDEMIEVFEAYAKHFKGDKSGTSAITKFSGHQKTLVKGIMLANSNVEGELSKEDMSDVFEIVVKTIKDFK